MATYVYCLVASRHAPSLARVPAGLRATGPVRLLDVSTTGSRRWLVVANAPLSRYGERAINARLADLAWVSRAAVAHEAVVEAFIAAPAVLPMKLFTIFSDDDRARAHVMADRRRVDRIVKRVSGHREWGVRVTLDRSRAIAPRRRGVRAVGARSGGAGYLARKQAHRDALSDLANRARRAADDLFDELASIAGDARRRSQSDLPAHGGPLLLDSVFLVRSSREARFGALVRRRARTLAPAGFDVALSGPWPPYGFIESEGP